MGQVKLLVSLSLFKSFLHDNLVALLIFRIFLLSPQYLCGKSFAQRTAQLSVKSKSKMNWLFLTGQVSIELILHHYSMCCTN